MSLDLLFTIASIVAALVGLGGLFVPAALMGATLPAGSPVLLDTLRGFGGVFLGVAVLNWLARGAEKSRARDAIVLANTIGFLSATVFMVLAVLHDYPVWGWILAGINALLTIGFFFAGMGSMSSAPSPAKESSMPAHVTMPPPAAMPAAKPAAPAKSPPRKAVKKATKRKR